MNKTVKIQARPRILISAEQAAMKVDILQKFGICALKKRFDWRLGKENIGCFSISEEEYLADFCAHKQSLRPSWLNSGLLTRKTRKATRVRNNGTRDPLAEKNGERTAKLNSSKLSLYLRWSALRLNKLRHTYLCREKFQHPRYFSFQRVMLAYFPSKVRYLSLNSVPPSECQSSKKSSPEG